MSTLGISAITLAQLEMRMSRNTINNSREFEVTEAGLRVGERILLTSLQEKCLIPLQAKPWQSKTSCIMTTDKNEVHYVIEALPQPFHVYVLSQNNRWQALYYRITAWVSSNDNLPTILQSTYGIAGLPCPECDIRIHAGRMSWREFTSVL